MKSGERSKYLKFKCRICLFANLVRQSTFSYLHNPVKFGSFKGEVISTPEKYYTMLQMNLPNKNMHDQIKFFYYGDVSTKLLLFLI